MRLLILFLVLTSFPALAALKSQMVDYKDGDVALQGYLAFDTKFKGPRPAVLVVHEWMGLDAYAKKRADMLASLGYIAFAADIYGKGVFPKSMDEAAKISGDWKVNPAPFRARVKAGIDAMTAQKNVNAKKVAAIGYCFGGTAVLELARAGSEIQGVVSFHGGLSSKEEVKNAGVIKTKILVLNGADDPFVKRAEVQDFIEEMQKSKADWQLIDYGNSVHKFSNPEAGNDPSKGFAYNKLMDDRSWAAMKAFFNEIL